MKLILTTLLAFTCSLFAAAQPCTSPGQTPSTAFPVCGTSTFKQTIVPICSSHNLIVPGCSDGTAGGYQDKNPFWYKFTCYKSGSLGFLISPVDQGDDYDWQLYDITGHDPNDVFTQQSLIVTANWAGTYGNTGASNAGVNFIQCGSDPTQNKNTFSKMPNLIQGHTYLLMVSHFTDSQIGYDLSFGGGTAIITDTVPPHLQSATTNCAGDLIRLKLKKKVKCSSLAGDGSDFLLSPANATIVGITGFGCSDGFDTDSIEIKLSTTLLPGNYSVIAKAGSDGNTLLDYCDNPLPDAEKADFVINPLLPTPMDSLTPVRCSPASLRLVFQKPIQCSSIAANGSDFTIGGTYSAVISGATGICGNTGTTKEIIVTLATPLYREGQFSITLKKGSDGNSIIDECGKETPPGAALSFAVLDTVNADFTYQKAYGCTVDTIRFFHPGANGVNAWKWDLDDNLKSSLQNPQGLYTVFDQKTISLIVSNGFCSDTSLAQTVLLDNFLKADFTSFEDNCPKEPVTFTSSAQGHIVQHLWSFGDGGSSLEASPTYTFPQPDRTRTFLVTYTVTDSIGCQSSAQKPIYIYSSCYLAVPNAFTPNNDGQNDYLRVLNAIKTEKLEFRVFNRWGQLIFKTADWKKGWDGKVNGVLQSSGVYVWFLTYTDRDTKETRTLKGTATLVR